MYELANKNNNLTDQTLDRLMTKVEKLVSEGSCRFEAGITDTPELGKVSSLNQIFRNAVLVACRDEKIGINEKTLDANITYGNNGPLFGDIPVGGYERANFKRNLYAREFAQVFKTAMGPEIRAQMLVPLRAALIADPVIVPKQRSLVAA